MDKNLAKKALQLVLWANFTYTDTLVMSPVEIEDNYIGVIELNKEAEEDRKNKASSK